MSLVRVQPDPPKGWFDSISVVEGWGEGSTVQNRVICAIDNNLWLTLGETNNIACSAVKALPEYNAGAFYIYEVDFMELKIEYLPIEALRPYDKNTKKHDDKQIANVAESIKQYGFVQPIVVDKNNGVVIGHCRLLAAKKLKMAKVPCVSVDDLTDEQVRALRIVDNKSNESPWDFDLLANELADIDLGDFDFDFGIDMNAKQSNVNIDDFFVDAEQKPKEPKKIQCPHCGEWFDR